MNDCGSMGSGVKFCFNDCEFELSHVLWEVVIIADSGIGEPGCGFSGRVGAEEGGLEIFDKVREVSKGGGV